MALKDFQDMKYHPVSEKIVKVLQTKTQNTDPLFFRVIVAYYFGVAAAHMRASIKGWVGKVNTPINVYAINLAPSGVGKGHSSKLIEEEIFNQFRESFVDHSFKIASEANLDKLALKRAGTSGDPQQELEKITKEFNSLGSLMFTFDKASEAAIKQMRQKLLMANAGALALQVDEIGSNLAAVVEPLATYLELYDMGTVKDRLLKSTSENVRFEKINGQTPANLLLFGTPSKLLDGGTTENTFMELLETGYARRCFFGFTRTSTKAAIESADELMKQLFNVQHDKFTDDISDTFGLLADAINMNREIVLEQSAVKYLIEYRINCEKRAADFTEIQGTKKAELEHRYYKVLKLAGAYAFIDNNDKITVDYLENAIKLAEDSGKAFEILLAPERPYVKLAKYLADMNTEVTLADLDADLPAFRGSKSQKEELISMAIAWGYKNNIIIKRSYLNGIMFLKGESITETDLDELIISYGTHEAYNYKSEVVPFDKLSKLFALNNYHWINHALVNGTKKLGHRNNANCLPGFNMLVLDVDGQVNIETAMMLLKPYSAIYYTTKSHTEDVHRFRIVIPLNYKLKLNDEDYKQLYRNVVKSLPFNVDEEVDTRSKKWLTNANTIIHKNDGELFDILPYIPNTTKNEDREKLLQSQSELDSLERWVINNTGTGNRSNMLVRYSLILVEAGFQFDVIRDKVLALNTKLQDKLDEMEISTTILKTVMTAIAKRA